MGNYYSQVKKKIHALVDSMGDSEFFASRQYRDYVARTVDAICRDVGRRAELRTIQDPDFTACTNGNEIIVNTEGPLVAAYDKRFMKHRASQIRNNAFARCYGLKQIILPESLVQISHSAFLECRSLEEVTLPKGLATLSDRTFMACEGLKSIALPSHVRRVGADAFRRCSLLSEVELPQGLAEIGDDAFAFTRLTGISLPKGLKKIGEGAFRDCPLVAEVRYAGSVQDWRMLMSQMVGSYGGIDITARRYLGLHEREPIVCADGMV